MKKLFLLLVTFCLLATACNGGLGDDENNPTPSIPKIELSQQTIDAEFEPNTYTVSVTSPYSWKATSDSEWITIESKTGIAGTEELVFSVKHNTEVKERKGTIAITNSAYNLVTELYVIQEAFEPSDIVANPNSLNFTVEGGEKEIAITANFEYEADTSDDWVKITKTENGITVTVPTYDEVEERSANIVISSEKYDVAKTVKITQAGLSQEEYAKQSILYTTSNGKIITPYMTDVFGANIISNTYENGQGVISFDTPVTSIGDEAFAYCSRLTSITIPDSVTSIGENAFYRCTSLTSVTIPDSVTSIGDCAFSDCQGELIIDSKIIETAYMSDNYPSAYGWLKGSNFTKLTIGDSVTSIGNITFGGCSSLTSVTIGNSVTSIGENAFSSCTSLTSVTIPDSVTSIGRAAFGYCASLTSVTISNSVTSIGDAAFCYCTSLTSITIGNRVTSIGDFAFDSCSSLTSVTIPNRVTSIGDCAFYSCSSLTSVTIPNRVTSIGYSAFESCSSLTSVTIGNSVTSIGKEAFAWCSSLTSVYCKATTPPRGKDSMFKNNASGRKIYVPQASVEAYKSAQYWSDYAGYIVGHDF